MAEPEVGGTLRADGFAGPDVKDVRTLADKDCRQCWGKGVVSIVHPSTAGDAPHGMPILCDCVVRYLKKHPEVALEFLYHHGQVH